VLRRVPIRLTAYSSKDYTLLHILSYHRAVHTGYKVGFVVGVRNALDQLVLGTRQTWPKFRPILRANTRNS